MFSGPLAGLLLVSGVTLLIGGCPGTTGTPAGNQPTTAPADQTTQAFSGNVFFESILPDKNYKQSHNSTSPDGTKMLLTINKSDTPWGTTTGVVDLYMLDAEKMAQGQVVKLLGPVSIGTKEGTPKNAALRSNWSADGTTIMVAGTDRFWVINAADLKPLNGTEGTANLLTGSGGTWYEVHDALPTTDSKYSILNFRTKPHTGADAAKMDGEIKLFDHTTNALVGSGVSVCNSCHTGAIGGNANAILCGIEGKVDKRTDGKYAGTVYVAGHGGHIAKVGVTVDPANTTTPIAITLDKLTVSTKKFSGTGTASDGTSEYKLHDVRMDGTNLFWSTFNTDSASKVHYGKIDLTTGTLAKDVGIPMDPRAKLPAPKTVDSPQLYCGSGQSKSAFMPITMTNEAYITVIPKF